MSKRSSREPLHRRIAAALRPEILRARPGQLLGSQNELARRFRVSALTVREALSALEEEGLIERRQGSGTYVADPARRQHVAILIELDISHPRTSYYYLRLTQQLRVILKEKGFRPRLYAGHVGPDTKFDGQLTCHEFLEDLEAGRICGVAAVALDAHESWMRLVREKGIPVVGSGVGYEYEVVLDVGKLVRSGIEYLTAHGRRDVVGQNLVGQPRHFHLIDPRALEHGGVGLAAEIFLGVGQALAGHSQDHLDRGHEEARIDELLFHRGAEGRQRGREGSQERLVGPRGPLRDDPVRRVGRIDVAVAGAAVVARVVVLVFRVDVEIIM